MPLDKQTAIDRVAALKSPARKKETAQKFFNSFMGRQGSEEEITYFISTFYNEGEEGSLNLDAALKTFFESKEFLFRTTVHAIGADREFKQLWARGEKTSLLQLISWALQSNDEWLAAKQKEQERINAEMHQHELNLRKKKSLKFEVLGVTISPLGLWGSQE